MTDERDPSGRPGGDPDNGGAGEGGMREPREPNGRDPQQRQGFAEPEPGLHRGPRRSRYGRRRMPSDGPGEIGGGGFQQDHRQQDHRPPRAADPAGDDVENYLPSFIAGPSNGGAPDHQAHQPQQSHQPHQPAHNPSHQSGHQPHQSHQTHQQAHQPSHQGQAGGYNAGAPQGGGHQGGYQPMPQADHQGGYQGGHQASPPPVIEEPSPEIHAAVAAFAEWETSNPKLRGQLICSATVKRGEPLVRGTRIPARILAAIAKMGSSVEEMLQDYPALTKEGLDAALAFASANPRPAR